MAKIILGKKKYPVLRKDKWLRMILRDKYHVIQVRWLFRWIDIKIEVMDKGKVYKVKEFEFKRAADKHYEKIKGWGKVTALNMI